MPRQLTPDDNRARRSQVADDVAAMERALAAAEATLVESWEVSEQLLLAGLREHALAEQLGRHLAFYRALSCSLGEGVLTTNRAGCITFVNPAAQQLLGQPQAELLGCNVTTILHDEDDPLLREVVEHGTSFQSEEALFHRSDDSAFPVAFRAAPIKSNGQIEGAVISFHDITEMLQLQRSRDETVALLSHDLRAPLAAILMTAQVLQRNLKQQGLERETGWSEILVASAKRMNGMIQEVLDRNFQETTGWTPVDLVQLCQRLLAQLEDPVAPARIYLNAAGPLLALVNALEIERVVVNLLSNALKYSTPGSPVLIRVSGDEQQVLVEVSDQGPGIAATELPHLFSKFYRTQTSHAAEGIGLGLYGSRKIVEAHGGRIWATSVPGQGSTFSFALPRHLLPTTP